MDRLGGGAGAGTPSAPLSRTVQVRKPACKGIRCRTHAHLGVLGPSRLKASSERTALPRPPAPPPGAALVVAVAGAVVWLLRARRRRGGADQEEADDSVQQHKLSR